MEERHFRGCNRRRGFLTGWLQSDKGAPYLRQLKSAIGGGLRPSSLITREGAHAKWKKIDYILFEACANIDYERCGQCGLPRYVCHNQDHDIQFKVVEDTCNAKAAVDTKQKQLSKSEKYEPTPGTTLIPEPFIGVGAEGKTLFDYYEPHLKREHERYMEKLKLRES